jgi:hypothetical protein
VQESVCVGFRPQCPLHNVIIIIIITTTTTTTTTTTMCLETRKERNNEQVEGEWILQE